MRRYRPNQFRLEAPSAAPERTVPTIAGRHTLGLIVNPKTKEPVLATTDGEFVAIRSLREATLLMKLGEGYHSNSQEPASSATGYPRVHTPRGVTIPKMGYGTALYSALCCGAHLEDIGLVEISMSKSGNGICSDTVDRSKDADRWWAAALKIGLTDEEVEEEEEKDENVDINVDADDLDRVAGLDEGKIVYVNQVNVDIEKTSEKTFDYYTYKSLEKHNLLVASVVVDMPGVYNDGADLSVLWRKVLEEPGCIDEALEAPLLALDVRGLDADAISLLSLLYMAAGLKDAEVDAMRERWERRLDPGATSPQGRLFRANGMADVAEAREFCGWEDLSDLP